MKVYEHEYVFDMNYSHALVLEDDGRFNYTEAFWDPAGAGATSVNGTWRREDDTIFLLPLENPWRRDGWEVGREREVSLRGDVLDLGDGFALHAAPDREQEEVVRNVTAHPVTVAIGGTGERHELAPGEAVHVVARGPGGLGVMLVDRGEHQVVAWGWRGAQVSVIREHGPFKPPPSPLPAPSAPPRAPRAAAASPVVRPSAAPPTRPFVVARTYARFEPRAPSPELAGRIGRWVEELSDRHHPSWMLRLCKASGAIPLACTQIYLWMLRPDGQVLCVDHESGAQRVEPETLAPPAFCALAKGARTFPEIAELLPPDGERPRECDRCEGRGWTEAHPPAQGAAPCVACSGIGFRMPDED